MKKKTDKAAKPPKEPTLWEIVEKKLEDIACVEALEYITMASQPMQDSVLNCRRYEQGEEQGKPLDQLQKLQEHLLPAESKRRHAALVKQMVKALLRLVEPPPAANQTAPPPPPPPLPQRRLDWNLPQTRVCEGLARTLPKEQKGVLESALFQAAIAHVWPEKKDDVYRWVIENAGRLCPGWFPEMEREALTRKAERGPGWDNHPDLTDLGT